MPLQENVVGGEDEEDYDEDEGDESEDIDDDETTPAGRGFLHSLISRPWLCAITADWSRRGHIHADERALNFNHHLCSTVLGHLMQAV